MENHPCFVLLIAISTIVLATQTEPPGAMTGIQSGSIVLSGNDIGTAQSKTYTVALSSGLGNDPLSYAFALAGFQAPAQNEYSVLLKLIAFSNNQTLMSLEIYFKDINSSTTQWLRLKWTYLLVSSTFDGSYSNIWATFAQFTPKNSTNTPIHNNGLTFLTMGGLTGDCDIYVDPLMQVDLANCAAVPANGQYQGGKVVIHAYISGFSLLGVTNLSKTVSVSKGSSQSINSDSFGWEIVYSSTYPNGPKVTVSPSLSYLQLSFLYVRMDYYALQYPLNSNLKFTSSHVFTRIEHYDTEVALSKGSVGQYNQNYFKIPDSAYQIYGLSSFSINPTQGLASVEVELDELKYRVSSPSGSIDNVVISGDLFIKNIKNLCNSIETPLQGLSKEVKIVPTSSILSAIDVTNNVPYSQLTHSSKPKIFKYGIVSSTQDMDATFSTKLQFTGITAQQTVRAQIRFFEAFGSPSLIENGQYTISVSVNGIQVLKTVYLHHSSQIQYVSPIYFRALKSASTKVQVDTSVTFKSKTASQELYLLIAVYSESAVYNPSTKECLTQCPQSYGIQAELLPLICLSCNTTSGMSYNILEGDCACTQGMYSNNGVCQQCGEGCATCDPQNPTFCLSCIPSAKLNAGVCDSSNCPSGTVAVAAQSNSSECLPCQYPCKTCISHQYHCTSCEEDFYLYRVSPESRTCLRVCPLGTLLQGLICQPCREHCSACLSVPSNCIQCQPNYILYKSKCVQACPSILWPTPEGTFCLDNCPPGLFKGGNQTCLPCGSECLTCDLLASNCTGCKEGVLAEYGVCVNNCLETQYISGGLCFNCSYPCSKCFKAADYCVGCPPDMVVDHGKCIKECPLTYFYQDQEMVCKSCGKGCSQCINPNQCSTCLNQTYSPKEGKCPYCEGECQICGPDSRCLVCPIGLSLFNGACREVCPPLTTPVEGRCSCLQGVLQHDQCQSSCSPGFYYQNGICVTCNSNCLQCLDTNRCTKCFTGFKLVEESCLNTNVCNYGQDFKGGKCSRSCKEGQYFFEGNCLFGQCPNGYQSNPMGGCVRSWRYTCPDHHHYLQGNCLPACPPGYFSSNFRCLPCPSHCDSCANSRQCFSCSQNYSNIDGQCYYNLCSNGTVAVGSECLSQCPTGTVLRNQVCVMRCTESTFFFDPFCYFTCPTGKNGQFSCLQ